MEQSMGGFASLLRSFFLLVAAVVACMFNVTSEGRPIHALKTIVTAEGDVFDCVDIYKQPALDHPRLKDHQILMKPNLRHDRFQKVIIRKQEAKDNILSLELEDGGCPSGTVPIHRLPKARNHTSSSILAANHHHHLRDPDPNFNEMYARIRSYRRTFFGGSSKINVYGVNRTQPGQVSAAMIWLANWNAVPENQAIIQAGWMVSHDIYHDNKTRLTALWTHGTTDPIWVNGGSGFVQISRNNVLGVALPHLSTIRGYQWYIYLHIYKDDSNNWWLAIRDVDNHIGYWPAALFDYFDHASNVLFGGMVSCHNGQLCPPMGNGIYPTEDGESCTMKATQVIGADYNWGGLGRKWNFDVTKESCYRVNDYGKDVHGYKFYFGGPECNPDR